MAKVACSIYDKQIIVSIAHARHKLVHMFGTKKLNWEHNSSLSKKWCMMQLEIKLFVILRHGRCITYGRVYGWGERPRNYIGV
jgi:hypothetical protein